tara:strand:- start:1881 stop:2555 length:675 start_codon:yes stop_codon:yes gene_type:complete
MIKNITLFLILTIGVGFQGMAWAQGIKPAGLNAYAGAGYVEYTISAPATNFKMDRGVFASIAGEKGFGILGSYLTFSTSYLKSKGSTNYDYTPLGKTAVTANGISFDSDLFQFGLGFKIKLFESSWFRPYAEVGVLGGYYQLTYKGINSSTISSGTASDAKTKESLFDNGQYGEAGLEIDFAKEFALKVSGRILEMKTGILETLGGNRVLYRATTVFLSVLKAF